MKPATIFAFMIGLALCVLACAGGDKCVPCDDSGEDNEPESEQEGDLVDSKGDGTEVVDKISQQVQKPVNGIPAVDYSKGIEELYQLVANSKYDNAISLIKALDTEQAYGLISETVQKLLDSHSTAKTKLMSFAYKLWNSGDKDAVQNNFPDTFKNVLDQDHVKIVNKEYGQALKLDANTDGDGDRLAWGDSHDTTSKRVNWKFIPVWEKNEVIYKIYNIDRKMYLKLAVDTDSDGDHRAYGSNDSDTDRHKFILVPRSENGVSVFIIINFKYKQGLKLVVAADQVGDRALMSHNGDIYENNDRFRWTISAL